MDVGDADIKMVLSAIFKKIAFYFKTSTPIRASVKDDIWKENTEKVIDVASTKRSHITSKKKGLWFSEKQLVKAAGGGQENSCRSALPNLWVYRGHHQRCVTLLALLQMAATTQPGTKSVCTLTTDLMFDDRQPRLSIPFTDT